MWKTTGQIQIPQTPHVIFSWSHSTPSPASTYMFPFILFSSSQPMYRASPPTILALGELITSSPSFTSLIFFSPSMHRVFARRIGWKILNLVIQTFLLPSFLPSFVCLFSFRNRRHLNIFLQVSSLIFRHDLYKFFKVNLAVSSL